MGTEVETLADLFPTKPRLVCIGINPTPVSVTFGHYYQGRLGRLFFGRLGQAGVFTNSGGQHDDDAAFAEGIGFTDVVKRPTVGAGEVTAAELQHGRCLLEAKLDDLGGPALIFPFKKAAVALLGRFAGNGWHQKQFAGCAVFVMPGPFENRESASLTIATLSEGLR